MTTPSNPYAGLIERLRERSSWGLSCSDGSTCYQWDGGRLDDEASEALSRLTRDVEEAREALAKIAYAVSPLNSDDRETLRRNSKVAENIARATLTRLSRPTELGADPAFVASQSSPSVSTKGFNRGERKEVE